MGWIRRETEKGTTQYICPNCHDYHEFREDFGEQTFSENFIFCRRCGARNGTGTAPTLTPPNEWVSVEDSIPCSGKRVLATDGSFVGEAWYASFSKSWYRNNGFEWDRICGQVTHWMPLPAPPKKEHDHE